MKDIFRLIIVATMSFAVVGVAMLYAHGDTISDTAGNFVNRLEILTSSIQDDFPNDAVSTPANTLAIMRPYPHRWIGLSNFPDQTELSFLLPKDTRAISGNLNLELETDLTPNASGLLNISLNGTLRERVRLDPGNSRISLAVSLSPSDLSQEYLTLHLSSRGNSGEGIICGTDANLGNLIQLLPASALILHLEAPPSALGVIASSSKSFAISPTSSTGDNAFPIWAAHILQRAGANIRFGDATDSEIIVTDTSVTSQDIHSSDAIIGARAVLELVDMMAGTISEPKNWPVNLGALNVDTSTRTFRGSRRWNIPFAATSLPGASLPESLRLLLKTTSLTDGNDWLLRISLNENLIESRRFPGTSEIPVLDIPLPPERMQPQNTISVELIDTTPNEDPCTRPMEAQAQILPESALLNTMPATTAWAEMVEELAQANSISIASIITPSPRQAAAAANLLGDILPRSPIPRFDAPAETHILISDRSNIAQAIASASPTSRISIIMASPDTASAAPLVISIPSQTYQQNISTLNDADVLLVVIR